MKEIKLLLKIKVWMLLFLGYSFTSFGQIDLSDTTALAIAHWKKDEIQNYKVTFQVSSTEEDKVITSESVSYDLTIKVVDSTQVGYILEWTRSNFEVIADNDIDRSIYKITGDIPIWILTDEFGSSPQVLNWEDVGNEVINRAQNLIEIYKGYPEVIKKINRLIRKASSKEEIELNLVQDVQQFLAFHGAKYKFDERIDFQVKVPNNYGGDSLDANSTLILDQVNLNQGTFIIRSAQRINPNQLTAVTYDYLSSLNMVGGQLPPYEEFPIVTKIMWGGCEIHGNSGWVIFSEETKQTSNYNFITLEERTIEILTAAER